AGAVQEDDRGAISTGVLVVQAESVVIEVRHGIYPLALDGRSSSRGSRETRSGLEIAHRRGQGIELDAPRRRRRERTHDELREADRDELLDALSQRGKPDWGQLEGSGP